MPVIEPGIEPRIVDGHLTPTVGGRPVHEVVRTCHDKTIDAGLAALADPGITRDTLEPILTYCAEQR